MTSIINWTLQTVFDRCEEVGECWIWKQSCKAGGIPQASIGGKTGLSVRGYVYDEILKKIRPAKSVIGSTCRDTKCCNPAHLVWRSRAEVISESYRSGARGTKTMLTMSRRQRAIDQGLAKITMEKATEIRTAIAAGAHKQTLADEYGIGISTVRAIDRGRIWRPVGAMSIFNLGG